MVYNKAATLRVKNIPHRALHACQAAKIPLD